MDAKIFRVNYKSDFILTLTSDAGWMTPFCIKFWTGAPSQAYYAQWDGETYTHCAYDPSEPTKLTVQFDDHHLPIGELKYQVAYHFTVADFPNDTEDEVLNPGTITTEIDGEDYQVMLDFTGETAPEIQFSLPAYANEAQRIANEEQRIANEETRIQNEEQRIAAEQTRQQNEATRIAQEEARVTEFARLKRESEAATGAANDAADLANQKAQLAADKAALAQAAATLAGDKAQLADDKAALADAAATLANEKAALAQQKAEYAQTQGNYANTQGDYAKAQGDTAQADHERAAQDHEQAAQDHERAENDHAALENVPESVASTSPTDLSGNVEDVYLKNRLNNNPQVPRTLARLVTDNAKNRPLSESLTKLAEYQSLGFPAFSTSVDYAEGDPCFHDRRLYKAKAGGHSAGTWNAAHFEEFSMKEYTDTHVGIFDVSVNNGGAVFASLQVLLSDANLNTLIPAPFRRGGITITFVQGENAQSSDNKYVQYRCMAQNFTTDVTQWQGVDDEPIAGSNNLIKSGGVESILYHQTFSSDVSVKASGQTRIALREFDYGTKVAVRIVSNTATLASSAIIQVSIRKADDTFIYKDINTSWTVFETTENNPFDRIYAYINGEITQAGTVTLELIFKDAFNANIFDTIPTENSKKAIESGAVYTGFATLSNSVETVGTYAKNNISKLREDIDGKDNYTSGGWIARDGLTIISNSDYAYSDYINVTEGDNIIVRKNESDIDLYALIYPIDEGEIEFFTLPTYTISRPISIPSGYNRLRFSFKKDADAKVLRDSTVIWEKTHEKGISEKLDDTVQVTEELQADVTNVMRNSLFFMKNIHISGRVAANSIIYPLKLKANDVVFVTVESDSIIELNGFYLRDSDNNDVVKKYNLVSGESYEIGVDSDVASFGIWFETSNFKPGYNSGTVDISIRIEQERKYLGIPIKDIVQSLPISIKKGEDIKLRFNGDTSKLSMIAGIYLIGGGTDIVTQYSVSLNEWILIENVSDDIDVLEVYTTAATIAEATNIIIDIVSGENMVEEIAYENKNIISAVADKRDVVPDYFYADGYLDEKVKRINKLAQEADDTFIFTTDEHWEFNAQVTPAIIKYLERYCNFSKMISTGDHAQSINEYKKAELSKYCLDYMHMLCQINKPIYSSIGNHAYLTSQYPEGLFDNVNLDNWVKYAYYLNYKDVIVGNNTWMYFYLDDNLKKLRYVFLNSFEKHEEETIGDKKRIVAKAFISSAQLSWFENVALNVESGYGIIVVVHSIVGVNCSNQSTNDQTIYISQNADIGYKNCANVILKYTGNADFIVMLSGHTHRDGIDMVDDVLVQNTGVEITNNAFFNLCTTCDAFAFPPSMSAEFIPHRHGGTINECAFDVCIINRAKHRIDMVRIGDKANLIYNFSGNLEERAVVYQIQNVAVGGTKSLENDIEGTASWVSSNTAVATVNDGIVTGVSVGIAKISVEDTTNHRAIVYIVKVN